MSRDLPSEPRGQLESVTCPLRGHQPPSLASHLPCSLHFCEFPFILPCPILKKKVISNTSTVDPKAPNLHPVSGFEPKTSASDLFGDLQSTDLEWTCAGGFVAETQTFYHFLEDDTMLMCQVIHSSIGSVLSSSLR